MKQRARKKVGKYFLKKLLWKNGREKINEPREKTKNIFTFCNPPKFPQFNAKIPLYSHMFYYTEFPSSNLAYCGSNKILILILFF